MNLAERVGALTDEDLAEYVRDWQRLYDEFKVRGDGYSAWWSSKHVSLGINEQRARVQRDAD
jgi:hypothetical protein